MLLQAFEMDARKDGIQQGIRQGVQQGKSIGLAEGSRKKALETAQFMKQANCDISFIAQATGLSEREIEYL